jgi:drug/metabolite transporter (DMT)-like permease
MLIWRILGASYAHCLYLSSLWVLIGVLLGGEPLTVKTIGGMLLTVGGIVLLTIG